MKTIYIESPCGEVHILEYTRTDGGYNVYIDDSNECNFMTEEELFSEMEEPTF